MIYSRGRADSLKWPKVDLLIAAFSTAIDYESVFERFKEIAELVALIAVVIGLVFGGFELRQN